jgi:RNA polymerase sigma-70 factor (ECF subfamily)
MFKIKRLVDYNTRYPTMSDTSVSLLDRLRLAPSESLWKRLVDLYTPLIQDWLRRQGVQQSDADDLVQEVLTVLMRELPRFQHNGRPGAFRSWLRVVSVHRLRDFWRSRRLRPAAGGGSDFAELIEQMEDPDSGLSRIWDQEHDRHVARRALELIQSDFAPSTWRAFHSVVIEGRKEAAVAAELGISTNAVFIAKSRVLARLRQEIKGLVD